MSKVNAVWQIYLFYGINGLGIGLSPVDVIALSTTARWFVRRRSMMSGLVKVGTGTGQLVIPFAASIFIIHYGWRTSYIIIAVFGMLILAGTGQLLRRDPSQMGLLPDGDSQIGTTGSEFSEKAFP